MRRIQPRTDAGFTLIEVLMTVVILGIITVPLTELLMQYFQNTTQAQARLNESHDAQITAAYFAEDVASVGTRDQATQTLNQSVWVGNTTGAPYACGGVTTPVLLLASDQFSGPGSAVVVNEATYAVQSAGGQTQLVRYYCQGSAAVSAKSILAHDIDPTALPTVSCTGGGSTSCADHPAVPTTIQLTVTSRDPFDNTGSPLTVTLTGQRRQS